MSDDVAVVGLGCRLPGADDPRTLWRRLLDGVDSIRRYDEAELRAAGWPEDRLAGLLADPAYVPVAGLPDDPAGFDAAFFGIGGQEAALVDPQQRWFLEAAWSALEDAGIDPARQAGPIGVFAGAGPNRYAVRNLLGNPAAGPAGDPDDAAGLLGPTLSPDYLPTRVSYRLGLSGPSVAVQTACSSSLVAVCLAVQALQDFRCDVAVAGGASLAAAGPSPVTGYRHRPGLTAPDGLARPYDAGAAGSVPGSGAAAVVLKRLDDALADGDPVYAVVLGWGIANDGADRAGFDAPAVAGQAAAAREALAAAGLDTVGYVEGHGGATPVGDAIEVTALRRAYRSGPALLGSGKAALGNLDAASGVVGLLSAVLAVRHGSVPPTLNVQVPHPDLDLGAGPFTLATKAAPWPVAGPRRAAVHSVGQGGTSAHLIVGEPPSVHSGPAVEGPVELLLSARTPSALAAVAARLADHLEAEPATSLAGVAWTLATGRRAWPHRRTVVAADLAGAVRGLRTGGAAGSTVDPSAVDRSAVDGPRPARKVPLPAYPFERREHWIAPASGGRG
ncbi:MAG TPA: beta-ketoacyl synthase N-terminal-like domain-containing protein [Mycobacteriales bacterium]